MSTYSPSGSSPIVERDPSSGVVLWQKDEVELFDVESDFSDVIGDFLEVVDGSIPLDNNVHKDCKDAKQFLSALGKLWSESFEESS
jgi:hypothetical protein